MMKHFGNRHEKVHNNMAEFNKRCRKKTEKRFPSLQYGLCYIMPHSAIVFVLNATFFSHLSPNFARLWFSF